jgi:hypothetical protein
MSKISINLNTGALFAVPQQMYEQVMSAVDVAVEGVAQTAMRRWAKSINAADLREGQKKDYAESLRIDRLGMAHYLVRTIYDQADQIEDGRPARDLKAMLQTSQKTRMSKAGKKYLIIPFRHNTPGNKALAPAMPQAIYDQALKMGQSSILSTGSRISATGATVPQHNYKWDKAGDVFGKKKYLSTGPLPAGLAPIGPGHKTDIYAGMRRMDTSTGKSKSSSYLTFRVMHQDSTGWIVPAKPGLKLADKIAAQIENEAQGYIESVVKAALE